MNASSQDRPPYQAQTVRNRCLAIDITLPGARQSVERLIQIDHVRTASFQTRSEVDHEIKHLVRTPKSEATAYDINFSVPASVVKQPELQR